MKELRLREVEEITPSYINTHMELRCPHLEQGIKYILSSPSLAKEKSLYNIYIHIYIYILYVDTYMYISYTTYILICFICDVCVYMHAYM